LLAALTLLSVLFALADIPIDDVRFAVQRRKRIARNTTRQLCR
jgi:hypothetical protein